MIIVDSSALIAILLNELERWAFQNIIDGDEPCLVSAVNAHETACVLRSRLGAAAVALFWQRLTDNQIGVEPFDGAQVREVASTFDRYGKGINSKTRLNLGDCAAYALAKNLNAPLLYKGNDFTETDVMRITV